MDFQPGSTGPAVLHYGKFAQGNEVQAMPVVERKASSVKNKQEHIKSMDELIEERHQEYLRRIAKFKAMVISGKDYQTIVRTIGFAEKTLDRYAVRAGVVQAWQDLRQAYYK